MFNDQFTHQNDIIGRRRKRWRRWEERFRPHIKWMCDSMQKRDQGNESGLVYSHVSFLKGDMEHCGLLFVGLPFPSAIIILFIVIYMGWCVIGWCLMICVKAFQSLEKNFGGIQCAMHHSTKTPSWDVPFDKLSSTWYWNPHFDKSQLSSKTPF